MCKGLICVGNRDAKRRTEPHQSHRGGAKRRTKPHQNHRGGAQSRLGASKSRQESPRVTHSRQELPRATQSRSQLPTIAQCGPEPLHSRPTIAPVRPRAAPQPPSTNRVPRSRTEPPRAAQSCRELRRTAQSRTEPPIVAHTRAEPDPPKPRILVKPCVFPLF